MLRQLQGLWTDERGAGIVDSAIILAILALLAAGGYLALAPKIKDLFNKTGGEIDRVRGTAY